MQHLTNNLKILFKYLNKKIKMSKKLETQIQENLNICIQQYNEYNRENRDLYNQLLILKNEWNKYKINFNNLTNEEKINCLTKLNKKIPNTQRIYFYFLKGCKPCEKDKKNWKYIENELKHYNVPILKKEKTFTDGIRTYPCYKIYTKKGKMFMFRNDTEFKPKTKENLVAFFKKHLI